MGQQLYFDNYTATGDIIVLAVCFVIGILLATSHTTKSRTFALYINMIVYLALSAYSDILAHDYYAHVTNGNYTPVYVIRILYHAFLFALFLIFIVYYVEVLQIERHRRIPVMTASVIIYLTVIISDIVITVRGGGFGMNSDGTAVSGLNIFLLGYLAFVGVILYLMVVYWKRLYNKVLFGVLGTMLISFALLYNQGRYGVTSFTVATFMFPVLAILYLLHSNPYDIRTGAISASSVKDTVSYYYSKKRDFFFVSLYLPDFHSEGRQIPDDVQSAIRHFASRNFKSATLFELSNGHMLFVVPKKNNPNYEANLMRLIATFKAEYERYRFDYMVIAGRSIEDISAKNDYIGFIRSIQKSMKLNEIHMVNEEDIAAYNRSEAILKELEDIYKKQDLDDERVLVYCQPVYNIHTEKYDTAEALMRMKLPELGMVFPDQFIPLAEEHGYIHALTRIILHKTCDTIKELIAEGYEVKRISVNVSMPELRDENFTEDIENIIRRSNIPNGKVAIEITESESESDFILIKSMIEELQGTGIKFYLDDFGTGYSNMERIMKLPFDIIKFDRSLVLASESDKRSEEIVGRLAGMFSDLKYSVLYEGVENENDEERCTRMSASYLQGYKYSRPIPIGELRNFFSKTA